MTNRAKLHLNANDIIKDITASTMEENTVNLTRLLNKYDDMYYNEIFDILDGLVECGEYQVDIVGEDDAPIVPVYKKLHVS